MLVHGLILVHVYTCIYVYKCILYMKVCICIIVYREDVVVLLFYTSDVQCIHRYMVCESEHIPGQTASTMEFMFT